ncbi:Hsp20/alpha crystallin family protein [Aureimonas sp. D3]|uniref:Hsp20/alpha crystallin family protein n=1 Tax=Aureimonas sp. D3 TaxID=1638164 RepID=UPI0007812C71|nr:Hsp20/alpha crystallin family protein [Aureimonas sp. D3]
MVESATKLPVKSEKPTGRTLAGAPAGNWPPLEAWRHDMDQLFDRLVARSPFARRLPLAFERGLSDARFFPAVPAMDVLEHEDAYEITAELPGLDEKNIEVKLSNDTLTITGEKKQADEEQRKDVYLSERRYGSFSRSLALPRGVDRARIEATFAKGVLTLRLPKTREAMAEEQRIEVKAS